MKPISKILQILHAEKWLMRLYLKRPDLMCRIELQVLMYLTANIFGSRTRWILQYKPEKALMLYAQYTKDMLQRVADEDVAVLQETMYVKSKRLGALLRKISGLIDESDLAHLVMLLYRNIGIIMEGRLPGMVTVSQCYFSKYYTPRMCAVISSMDNGIVSGIFGGGALQFKERITEGCAVCKACFER